MPHMYIYAHHHREPRRNQSMDGWLVPGDYMWSFNTAGVGTPWVFVQFTITDDPSAYPQTIISIPVTLQELI